MQGMVSGIAGGCFFFPFFPHDDDNDEEEEEKRRRKRITRITKNTRPPITVVMLVGWRRYGATAVRSDDAAAIFGVGSDPDTKLHWREYRAKTTIWRTVF